ncbi:MAG: trypsin-like peptidase domain-containing protein, partial [Candidatus Omnitrophica bacterium]|nr:trypsin-like peptidase domain-containing protein [Candidatus Omnitrophota bacterium]
PVMQTRAGGGFIIHPSGLIVTNAHTIMGAGRVLVTLFDQTKTEASVVKVVPDEDLALLQIKVPAKLPAIPLADSNQVQLDMRVFSVGSSQILKNTLSEGKITGIGMSKKMEKKEKGYVGLIQASFDIYQGDSGSPLLNEKGELVGLMAAKAIFQRKVTYAIPSNKIAKAFEEQLKAVALL